MRSSTEVPWPGSRGTSTLKPAAANASPGGRIDVGLPVKPWMHSVPAAPPDADQGSAPGMSSVIGGSSCVRIVVGERLVPPLGRIAGGFPLRERVDAVHRAGGQALVAAGAQLGED